MGQAQSRLRATQRGLLVPVVVVLGLSGCLASAEAQIENVEVSQRGMSFPGIPQGALLGDVSTSYVFAIKPAKLSLPRAVRTEIVAADVTLRATSGVLDLAFIRTLRMTVQGKIVDSDLPELQPTQLAVYERSGDGVVGPVLTMPNRDASNLLEHWKASTLLFTLEVAGTMPTLDWTADLTIGLTGRLVY